jgi:hypothetical protein
MQSPLFTEPGEADSREPLILLLGNVDHEGITSPLKSSGEQYKKKLLASNPRNWSAIVGHFYGYRVRAVVAKLNASVYTLLALPEYQDVANELFAKIVTTRNAVFVYEDLLYPQHRNEDRLDLGEHDSEDEMPRYGGEFSLYQPPLRTLDVVNTMLRRYDLNLVPYRTTAEITVIASQLLEEVLEGLLFRIYVPAGRLWANEVDRLLQLFRDYLLRTGRKGIRLNEVRTDHGTSYEFRGDDTSPPASLTKEFEDFSRLLDLCVSDPREAEAMLGQKIADPKEVVGILTRYSKEAKRIQLDLRHDRERKLLDIRQRLESELTESMQKENDWALIESLVAAAIPEAQNISFFGTADRHYTQVLPILSGGDLTVNIQPQIFQTVNGVVAREIRGEVEISDETEELLTLIRKHGAAKSPELTSAIQLLSDPGIPKAERLTCAQKLKAFVFRIGGQIEPAAMGLLTAYIEKKLGLK